MRNDTGIIRNRLKIESSINNAKRFMEVQKEFGSFYSYLWQFVDNKQIDNKLENQMRCLPVLNCPIEYQKT